ncbi:hypothetical protein TWF481_007333 [Arthrobotrys musiformis]|uniref:Uncharacterized protein n=1 Tax=Arthrobotrys musiformis TaxID=47236 RepID=A0AAV9WD41_9PEZI
MPDTTLQPFGTRVCTEPGAPHDMGERWTISARLNKARGSRSKNFEGLVANLGTGRCMEWKPAPANQFAAAQTSEHPYTTYGNLTSEICDMNNQYQYFKLNDFKNPDASLNFLPRMWNMTCPEGQRATIIAGPKRSLVAYGCGKGLWKTETIGAESGWFYFDAIQYKIWRVEQNSDRYQTILCCQREGILNDSFCMEAMRKEGQGSRTPDVFWMEMCTELFPNYPEFIKNRNSNKNANPESEGK